jgi:hypothetical protein
MTYIEKYNLEIQKAIDQAHALTEERVVDVLLKMCNESGEGEEIMCDIEAINESEKVLDKKVTACKRAEQRYHKQFEKHIEIIKRNRNTGRIEKLCEKYNQAYVYMTNSYPKSLEEEYKSEYLDFKCDLKTILQVEDIEIEYLDISSFLHYIITFSIPKIKNNFMLVIPNLDNLNQTNFEQMFKGKYKLAYNVRIGHIREICKTYDTFELGETINEFIKEYKKSNRGVE